MRGQIKQVFLWVLGLLFLLSPLRVCAQTDTTYINELNARSFSLLKEDPDSSHWLATEAIRLSKPSVYLKGLGDGYIRLGILEKDNGNFNKAIEFYRLSLGYRKKIGDKDLIARVYNNIGLAYSLSARYDSAVHYLTLAMRIAEELNLTGAQAMYAMNIGIAYEKNRDYEDALRFNHLGRKLYEQEGDSVGIMKSLINEANIFQAQQQYDKAIANYRKAMPLALMLEDEYNQNVIIGDMAVMYMNLDITDSALHYMRQSLGYNLYNENSRNAAIDMSNMGILFGDMGNADSAFSYLEASLALSEEIGEVELASNNAAELSELYKRARDYKRAFEYQEKHLRYSDSVFSRDKAAAIAEMQTRYETEKKESQIALLNKDKQLQEQELIRKTQVQRFMWAGVALLVLVSGLFFNRFKLKKQIEKQQALLMERKRISSELHDDLGAQLSTARMFLSNLKDKGSDTQKEIIQSSIGLIDNSIGDLRKIMDELQSATLREKGLIGATEELVNRIGRIQPIRFTLNHHGFGKRADAKSEHHLFRINQELINNTLKYAGASHVTIEFLVRDGKVILVYEDDGKGYDVSEVKRGYGLSNIASRAQSLGGTAEFDSAPGMGARVIVEIPYHEHTTEA